MINGKIEEISLPVEKVDIIISEWMGYFLLFESMLDSVLIARDRFLKSDGLLLPDKAFIHLTAAEDQYFQTDQVDFWENVYGFNFSIVTPPLFKEVINEQVPFRFIKTNHVCIKEIDLYTAKIEDLEFSSNFTLKASQNTVLNAVVGFFRVEFNLHRKFVLSTSPKLQPTHWYQSVMYLKEEIPVYRGEDVVGAIDFAHNKHNSRGYDITLEIGVNSKDQSISQKNTYTLA